MPSCHAKNRKKINFIRLYWRKTTVKIALKDEKFCSFLIFEGKAAVKREIRRNVGIDFRFQVAWFSSSFKHWSLASLPGTRSQNNALYKNYPIKHHAGLWLECKRRKVRVNDIVNQVLIMWEFYEMERILIPYDRLH